MASNRSLGRLTLDLIARIGGFEQGMSKAERVAQDRTKKILRTFSTLQRSLAGIFAAIGAGALVRSIVTATAEAEKSLAQLDATLNATGNAAGFSRQQLVRMADELSNSSVFSSREIIDAQSRLLTYTGIVGENLPRAMQAVIDYAAKFNVSLISAAESVGKAVERPLKGMDSLGKQGFYLSDQQKRLARDLEASGRSAESQALVLDMLEESTKGAAEATRNTFGGALEAVKNAARDLLTARDGLPELTAQLNQFAELLKDPATVEAANTLASGVLRFSVAAGTATGTLANLTKELGEFFARVVHGPDFEDQLKRAKKELQEVQGIIARGESDLEKLDPGTRYARMLANNIERQRARAEELQKQIASMTLTTPRETARSPGVTPGPMSVEPPATEEFLKLEASLKQQIALFGKTGEAAKIAYQIQAGQLDELSAKEQQRVLDLARQIDALKEAAEAEKELERSRLEFAEYERREYLRIQESLQDDVEDVLKEGGRRAEEVFDVTFDNILTEVRYSMREVKDEMTVFAEQAARNMQTAFADFLFDPFQDGLKGMLKGFIDVIRRMVAEVAAAKIFGSMGGVEGVGNFISGLIPGFASGGSFKVGGSGGTDSQLVAFKATPGEMVEIRTPGQARGGGGNITINVDARGAQQGVAQQLQMMLPVVIREAVNQSRAAVRDDFNRRGYIR